MNKKWQSQVTTRQEKSGEGEMGSRRCEVSEGKESGVPGSEGQDSHYSGFMECHIFFSFYFNCFIFYFF